MDVSAAVKLLEFSRFENAEVLIGPRFGGRLRGYDSKAKRRKWRRRPSILDVSEEDRKAEAKHFQTGRLAALSGRR
jgi:hypothetical protein